MWLTTVEWVGFKLTFLKKDICHDHEIDIKSMFSKKLGILAIVLYTFHSTATGSATMGSVYRFI